MLLLFYLQQLSPLLCSEPNPETQNLLNTRHNSLYWRQVCRKASTITIRTVPLVEFEPPPPYVCVQTAHG
jgi:hypothetical protein